MLCDKLIIRPSTHADAKAIRRVEKAAFGRRDEADLVRILLDESRYTLSLVAQCDDEIIGHILLTEIDAPVRALALSPLAVIPRYREMQVGTGLVRSATELCRQAGFDAIFAHGDVPYYERFGFSSALADPFTNPLQGPRYMALELNKGALEGKKGQIRYPEPLMKSA